GGGAVMHFANLVIDAGVEQDALGRGRLPGVNVSRDADVPVTLDGRFAGHAHLPVFVLRTCSARRPCWPPPCDALPRASSSRRRGPRPPQRARPPGAGSSTSRRASAPPRGSSASTAPCGALGALPPAPGSWRRRPGGSSLPPPA